MESALTISPPTASASRSASADLPLAVGPAISQMRGSMELVLTLVAPPGAGALSLNLRETLAAGDAKGRAANKIEAGDAAVPDLVLDADAPAAVKAALAPALADEPLDWCLQPAAGRKKR